MKRLVLVLALFSLPSIPSVVAADVSSSPTRVTELSGTAAGSGVDVTGTAVFGGQRPVEVADDPGNDANITPNVGDQDGLDREAGVDLLGATMSVPDPAVPELLVQWQVSALPPSGAAPEGVGYALPFKVGSTVYVVQAKFSNVTDPDTAPDVGDHAGAAFELRGDCDPDVQGTGLARCSHLAWIGGGFDTVNSIVSAEVPLGSSVAPAIAPGATLRPNDSTNPHLEEVVAGHQLAGAFAVDDRAPFAGFTVPTREVRLGAAPVGTDPSMVAFTAPAQLASDGSFTGTVPTNGMEPGTYDVFARACFADNCGIRSLGGVAVSGDPDGAVATLRLTSRGSDSSVFWNGGKVGNQAPYALPLGNNAAIQSCSNSPCFRYKLKVGTPGAARLRIGLDTVARNDNFVLEVSRPDGVMTAPVTNSNRFNSELFIANPPVGTYDILVRPYSAQNTRFTMRAKLEAVIPAPSPNAEGLLLPDLRPSAPYEFGFAAPILPNGAFPGDDVNPPLDVGGIHPVSCASDETLDYQSTRCLRFSFGLVNAGEGKFNVTWDGNLATQPPGPTCGDNFSVGCAVPARQCVEAPGSTPSFVSRPAGQMQFHYTHGHDHYKDVIYLELRRVTDTATGATTLAGAGRKLGYSPANQAIANWSSFDQPQSLSTSVSGCTGGSSLGMAPGWGDVYRFQRPGNYVDFGTNADGLYVVKLIADPLDHVLESNEGNNTSYTYVRVTGDRIDVLENGRGQGPWDPNKEIVQPRHRGGVPW